MSGPVIISCSGCGTLNSTMHINGDRKLCCRCHVGEGKPPADWHDGCMRAWEQKKKTTELTHRSFRRVILESPYAGNVVANVEYARKCVRHCLDRGDSPFASHLLFTQPWILNDSVPAERALGIEAGLAWGPAAEVTVAYIDRGFSSGVKEGIRRAFHEGRHVEYYSLNNKEPLSVDPNFYLYEERNRKER